MTLYATGDIQGCAASLERLLGAVSFDAARDRLWVTGDLVNRGPDSLAVLRRLVALDDAVTTVLGNHDLHLLAAAAGVSELGPGDTLQAVLDAPDAPRLIDWLRHRPLLHYDPASERVLVHAGIPPGWSLADARAQAAEVAALLTSPSWQTGLSAMYGNEPALWSASLEPALRRRYSINALTRLRFCDAHGRLDFAHRGPPGSQPATLKPWYEFPRTGNYRAHVYFGHWAALGLFRGPGYTCLDSGCVWGRTLTALPLDPPGEPICVPCADAV